MKLGTPIYDAWHPKRRGYFARSNHRWAFTTSAVTGKSHRIPLRRVLEGVPDLPPPKVHNPAWTDAENAALIRCWATLPPDEVSRQVGRTALACARRAWQLKLGPGWRSRNDGPKWLKDVDPAVAAFIRRHFADGVVWLAEQLDVPLSDVMLACACLGLVGMRRRVRKDRAA